MENIRCILVIHELTYDNNELKGEKTKKTVQLFLKFR